MNTITNSRICLDVRVAGWMTGRRVIVDGRAVMFEVAGLCNPFCHSCSQRIACADQRMRSVGDGVKYHWTSRDLRQECFLVIEECDWKLEEVVSRLSGLLALQISEIR